MSLYDKLGISRIAHAAASVTFSNGVGTYSNSEITANSYVMVFPQTGGITSLVLNGTPAAGKITLYGYVTAAGANFSGSVYLRFVIVR